MLLTMAVFRHLKCCDGWSFFVFLYSRRVLKRWVSCLLKWKRDRGSILRCRTVGEEKEKILLSSRKRKREKYCWSSEKSFFFWVSVSDGFFLTFEKILLIFCLHFNCPVSCERPTSRILRAFDSQEWYGFTERRNTKREKNLTAQK